MSSDKQATITDQSNDEKAYNLYQMNLSNKSAFLNRNKAPLITHNNMY